MVNSLPSHLERYLDLLAGRQRVVASNIANLDTPGFRAKDFDFQAEFARSLESGQPAEPRILEVDGLLTKPDGNNVSLDRESRLLAENSIRFQIASSVLRSHLRQVRSAIKEGQG